MFFAHFSRSGPLPSAAAFSLGLHAALLLLPLAVPNFTARLLRDMPLEIVLVNARSQKAVPQKPQAYAQANLDGGGHSDEGRAKSFLPALAQRTGNSLEERAQSRTLEAMQERRNTLLSLLRKQIASLPPINATQAASSQEREQMEQRQRLLDLAAEIEREVSERNRRERTREIGPATIEKNYALYYDALRERVEALGTQHFPSLGNARLYGELVMDMTLDARGRLVRLTLVRGSGQSALDDQALLIVRRAAPFAPFTAAMRREAEYLDINSILFKFTRDAGMSLQLDAANAEAAARAASATTLP